MSCTTILVGKKASYDGSTMIARNDDGSSAGRLIPKKMVIVDGQDPHYEGVISHVKVDLPEKAMRCSAIPNAIPEEGIWAACGINEENIAMNATETITSNERVLSADPLVEYDPAHPETPGGIGEEDLNTLVLPYIHSAREGVLRLGALLEKYGTYEMNGIAFSDKDEIWWMETIGGHHWMARRVPDECYAVIPNQLGLDWLDFEDAFGEQKNFLCSKDLKEFVEENHLDLSLDGEFNPRDAFGSHDDGDHVYNTPRAWYMLRYFNPGAFIWDGPDAEYRPDSDDLPWCMVPEKKITPEDIKYILSSHYQGTPYDPYMTHGDESMKGAFRPIGINRTEVLGMQQIRPYLPEECRALQWVSFGSNVFNALAPFYTNVSTMPDYVASTDGHVSTQSWCWTSRLIAALADASWLTSRFEIERYVLRVQSRTRAVFKEADEKIAQLAAQPGVEDVASQAQLIMEKANEDIAAILREEADETLALVLHEATQNMKNSFARSDA